MLFCNAIKEKKGDFGMKKNRILSLLIAFVMLATVFPLDAARVQAAEYYLVIAA